MERALAKVWAHFPTAQRLEGGLLGSRDVNVRASAARVVHDVFAMSLGLWAGWTVPRLRSMPRPANYIIAELVPPTTMASQAAAEEHSWWNKHVNRNVNHHTGSCPWALRLGLLRKGWEKRLSPLEE